jgi:hypothetical protein
VKPAAEMVSCASKCTFCRMFTCPVRSAVVNATTAKRLRYAIKITALLMFWPERGRSLDLFAPIPKIQRKMQLLYDVGLGYIRLGSLQQPFPAVKRKGLNWLQNFQDAATGAVYIFLMNLPRVCILMISANC